MAALSTPTHETKTTHKNAPAHTPTPKTASKAAAPSRAGTRAPLFLSASKSSSGAGQPLRPDVKHAVERSLGVDLSPVRIHSDAHANESAQRFSARAFTLGSDIFLASGERADDVGLIAHEAAHVVQQQGTLALQTWSSHSDSFEREAHSASAAVMRGETFAVQQRTASPRVQPWGFSDVLDKFAGWANNIPGFRMFTIVLGVNPVNMKPVERSAANIMRAVVEFIPGGALITQALDKYGVFDKVGNWVDEQINTLGLVGGSIKKSVDDFIHGLHLSDILDLDGVWERAKRIFTEPIDRIKKFVSGLVDGILKFIKDAILMPLAQLAAQTRGWDLLIAVLGKNPITGERVERNADNLIGGFMKFAGEEEVWNNLKKANAVARAWAWFQDALTGLMGFVSQIPTLFIEALKSLVIEDIILLPNALIKVGKVFGDFAIKFFTWAGNSVWNLLQIIFEVVAPSVMPYLKKVGAAFKGILKNPMGFVHNLVAAAKLGFVNFGSNFLTHLKAGLIEWLTGSLPGVYIPKAISLPEVGKFAMSVLGISWAQIRGKIVKALGPSGEKIMVALETTFDIVVALVTGGPAAAWELIKEKLTNLKDMVIDGITSFVIDTIVKKAIPKLISMFIPGAGFISAIVSIYDTIMVFVQKLAKIAAAVKAFVDSIVAIAAGQIEGAANKVESTLAGLLSLAISFLAGFLGLGNIASKVLAVIEKIRAAVDKALDTAINWVVDKAKKLWASAKSAVKDVAQGLMDWWKLKQPFKGDDGASHTLLFQGEDDAAQLVFESTPTQLDTFLASLKNLTPEQNTLVASIRSDIDSINAIRTFKKKSPTATEKADVQKNRDAVAAGLQRISANLGKLMGGNDWGTESKPLPISYPKPPIGSYISLYFGPKTTKISITQNELRAAGQDGGALNTLVTKVKLADPDAEENWSKRTNKTHRIEVFSPTSSPKSLPEGGGPLGVTGSYQTNVGMKFKLPKVEQSTPGGYLINDALKQYGYDPKQENTDGDHVLEIQFGGVNQFYNLWPLNSRMNQQAGSRLSSSSVPKPDGTTIKMADLKKEAKTRDIWLVIAQMENQ